MNIMWLTTWHQHVNNLNLNNGLAPAWPSQYLTVRNKFAIESSSPQVRNRSQQVRNCSQQVRNSSQQVRIPRRSTLAVAAAGSSTLAVDAASCVLAVGGASCVPRRSSRGSQHVGKFATGSRLFSILLFGLRGLAQDTGYHRS